MFDEFLVKLSSGVSLFVASTGVDVAPTLLVIHGGPDWDHSYLREPLAQLADRHRIILPDVRGCGRSSRGLADTGYTPDAVVADLIALADQLGLHRFSLLGFSWGGFIAQRVAVSVPDRIDRLILASSSVLPADTNGFRQWSEREERMAAEAAVWADSSLTGPQLTRAAAVAGTPANVWRAEARPDYIERLAAVRFPAEWMRPWRAGILPSARLTDPIGRLSATEIPILLLHGCYDMTFPASSLNQAAANLPDCRSVVLDEAAHMTHIDQPRAWLNAITDFLR